MNAIMAQGLDGFQKVFGLCVLDKRSLDNGRLKV